MAEQQRACLVCGWTTSGGRAALKKHRRAEHPLPKVSSTPPLPVRLPPFGPEFEAAEALRDVELGELRDEVLEEFEDALSHIHSDLVAIREHLGIPNPGCTPPINDDEPPT